jgi:hypothetical protein
MMIPTLDPENRDQTGHEFLADIRSGMFPQVACARRAWEWNDYRALLQREAASRRAVAQAEADCEAHLQGIVIAAAKGGLVPVGQSSEKPSNKMIDAAKWMLAKRFPARWSDAFEGLPDAAPRGYADLVLDLQRYAVQVEQQRVGKLLEGSVAH